MRDVTRQGARILRRNLSERRASGKLLARLGADAFQNGLALREQKDEHMDPVACEPTLPTGGRTLTSVADAIRSGDRPLDELSRKAVE